MLYTLLCIALLLYLVPLVFYGLILLGMGTAVGAGTIVNTALHPFRRCGRWFDYAVAGGVLAGIVCLAALAS
jgi:hypothetical protein